MTIDRHWRPLAPLARDPGKRRSLYLPMRDGTRIAVDIHLPTRYQPGQRLPTIVRQTRYFRSVEITPGFDHRFVRDAVDIAAHTRERFLGRGYAWVDVDVRGSGASSGVWPAPWSPDEVRDGGEIVDHIVAQPWSNGRVGSTGISYDGTTAEMLLVNQHPAVRAVAPRFSLFCAYEDVAFPGGAQLAWFTERWARFNRLLDDHRFHEAMAGLTYVIVRSRLDGSEAKAVRGLKSLVDRLGAESTTRAIATALHTLYRGARRVDDDRTGEQRARALLDHVANGDVHAVVSSIHHRDDGFGVGDQNLTFASLSPRGEIARLARSDAAIYSYGGFFDGAYGQSVARRFASLPRTRMLLGPWGHAGVIAHVAHGEAHPSAFDHDGELVRFFDLHLSDRDDQGLGSEPPVRYFTMGENVWRTALEWPPRSVVSRTFDLTAQRGLSPSPRSTAVARAREPSSGVSVRKTDFGTGERTRWRGVLAAFVAADYPDIEARTRDEVAFDGEVLDAAERITGHPSLRLAVRCRASDFMVSAYLLDVAPDGHVACVTEGHLRALHRQERAPEPGFDPLTPHHSFLERDASEVPSSEIVHLAIGMLPTSWHFARGHRVRLVVTLGDIDHFARITPEGAEIEVLVGGESGSTLLLPIDTAD